MTDKEAVPLAGPPMPMEELDAFERWFYSVEEHAHWSCLTPAYALAAKAWMAGRATVQPAAAQGWQPIETAPRDETKILVFTVHGDIEISESYSITTSDYEPVEGGLYRRVERTFENWNSNVPTHWMPLPPPPAATVTPTKDLGESKKSQQNSGPSLSGSGGES